MQWRDWFIGQNIAGSGAGKFSIYDASGAANRLTIDTSGNVGIGTTTPVALLQVGAAIGTPTANADRVIITGANSAPSSSAGNLQVMSNDSQAIDLGGSIVLGGLNTGVTANRSFAMVAGRKENSTGGNTAGYLQFSTQVDAASMSEKMRITSTGNVGIGTTNPLYKFQVKTGTDQNLQIRPNVYGATSGVLLQTSNDADSASIGMEFGASQFLFGNGANALFTGNVGIGTTTPNQKLDVFGGDVSIGDIAGATRGLYLGPKVSQASILYNTNGNLDITPRSGYSSIFTAGNVGIGTTNPGVRLEVASTDGHVLFRSNQVTTSERAGGGFISTGGASGRVSNMVLDPNGADFSGGDYFVIRGNQDNSANFLTENAVRMTILGGGNVGIGTTNPQASLSILRDGTTAAAIDLYNANATNLRYSEIRARYSATDSSFTSGIRFLKEATGANHGSSIGFLTDLDQASQSTDYRMYIKNGNVGIGTTGPSSKLHVYGQSYTASSLSDVYSSPVFRVQTQGATSNSSIFMVNVGLNKEAIQGAVSTSGASDLVLNPFGGNVGIGTTGPATKLDVSGSFRVTGGDAYFNSNIVARGNINRDDLAYLTIAGGTSGYTYFTGNVGIGTPTPGRLLELSRSGFVGVRLTDTSADGKVWEIGGRENVAGDFAIHSVSNGATRLQILDNGNVGIGTTGPRAKLDITNGTANIDGNSGNAANLTAANVVLTTSNVNLSINTNDAQAADIGGSIGLGGLYRASARDNVSFAIIKAGKTNSADGDYSGYLTLGTRNNGGSVLERMRIDNQGNVGIGTTGPNAKLDVISGASMSAGGYNGQSAGILVGFSGDAGAANNADGQSLVFSQQYTSGADKSLVRTGAIYGYKGQADGSFGGGLKFRVQPTGANPMIDVMTLDRFGNVGIGTTTPTSLLHLSKAGQTDLRIESTGAGARAYGIVVNPAWLAGSLHIYDFTSDNTRISIDSEGRVGLGTGAAGPGTAGLAVMNGNVGIGTTNPAFKFVTVKDSAVARVVATAVYNRAIQLKNEDTSAVAERDVTIAFAVGGADEGYLSFVKGSATNATHDGRFEFAARDGGTRNMIMSLLPSGNVGIGTTTPQFPLTVQSNSGANGLMIIGRQNGTTDEGTLTFADNDGNTQVYLQTNGSKLGIMNGNVGIGTTNPGSKLSVTDESGSGLAATIRQTDTAGGYGLAIESEGTSSTRYALILRNLAQSVIYGGVSTMTGQVGFWGLGVTPTGTLGSRLTVSGGASIGSGYTANAAPTNGMIIEGNVGIGTTDPGVYKLNINGTGYLGAAAWVYSSDLRLKENITYLTNASSSLDKILQLKPARFDYITGDKNNLGFIAQDVQQVIPEAVVITNQSTGMLGLKTEFIIPYVAGAIQELSKRLIGLESGITVSSSTLMSARLFVNNSTGVVGIGNNGISLGGELFRVSGTIRAQGFDIDNAADISETFPASEAVDAGTIVAFATTTYAWSPTATSTDDYEMSGVRKAQADYEAIGIVSTRPGIRLGGTTANGVPVALTGRVPVKITKENGDIKRGDYITVSKTRAGYGMKLTGEGKAIGIALSDDTGRDTVLVILQIGNHKLDMSGRNATTTAYLTMGNIDLNANAVAIFNIKSLASANGTWSIDENGKITAKILCLDDVCIDKTKLQGILSSFGQTGIVAGTSTTTEPVATTTTPVTTEPTATTTPVTAEPVAITEPVATTTEPVATTEPVIEPVVETVVEPAP